MEYINIATLPDDYAVIDMDTGTVLNTNLVLVRMPLDHEDEEMLLNSDSEARQYGERNGLPLYRPKENN